MMLETHMKLSVAAQDILEKSFGQNLPKTVFLKKSLKIKFWSCSVMKVYTIFCVAEQMSNLWKILRYGNLKFADLKNE